MIDLAPSPEQQGIVDSVVDFLASRCPVARKQHAGTGFSNIFQRVVE